MSGPMKHFAVVAVLLLLLVIYYATRLEPEPQPETEAIPEAGTEVLTTEGEAPVAATVQEDEERRDWFPDLRGHNDVPGVDLGATATRSTFGCDIEELARNIRVESRVVDGETDPRLGALLDILAASGDAELQLAAAQLSSASSGSEDAGIDPNAAAAALERAYRTDPANPLVLWNATQACVGESSPAFCAEPSFKADAEAALSSNGEYWVRVADRLHDQGDRLGALDALRRAATAPELDNYMMANVRMLQRALSMVPDTSYIQQALGAYAFSTMHAAPDRISACTPDASNDPELLDACLAIASRYESDGRTIAHRRLATRMQYQLYEATGQSDAAEEATARFRELQEYENILDEDLIAVMATDERVVSLFLEEFEVGNELSAMRFFGDEVERLKQDPEYNPCPSDENAEY